MVNFFQPPGRFFSNPPVILHLRACLTPPSRKAKNRNPNFKRSAAAPLLADGTTGGGPSANPGDHTITDRRATRAKIEVQVRKIPRPLRPRKMTRKTSKSSILHPQAPSPKMHHIRVKMLVPYGWGELNRPVYLELSHTQRTRAEFSCPNLRYRCGV